MQITLPDDAQLHQRATAAGFATVEQYLLELVQRDTLDDALSGSPQMSHAEWSRKFRQFLSSLPSRNPHVDDSRESIYADR